MKYPPSFFREGLPPWKRKKDPITNKLLYRPLSFLVAPLFCELGIGANTVSYISAIVALIACGCFVAGVPIAAAILINIWSVLDCVDGNIARCVKKEKFGDFADSMSSFICVGLMFSCMGFCVYNSGGLFVEAGSPLIILIGAWAGSCDTLMRLIYNKYLNSMYAQGMTVEKSDDPEKESGINRIRMKVDAYVSLGGFLPLATLFAAIFGALDLIVCAWACYYCCTFIASSLYFVRKTYIANKETDEEELNGNL